MQDSTNIQKALYDFNAQLKETPNATDAQFLKAFPEFSNRVDLLQAAKDYSANLNDKSFKNVEDINKLYPEFFTATTPQPTAEQATSNVTQALGGMFGSALNKPQQAIQQGQEQPTIQPLQPYQAQISNPLNPTPEEMSRVGQQQLEQKTREQHQKKAAAQFEIDKHFYENRMLPFGAISAENIKELKDKIEQGIGTESDIAALPKMEETYNKQQSQLTNQYKQEGYQLFKNRDVNERGGNDALLINRINDYYKLAKEGKDTFGALEKIHQINPNWTYDASQNNEEKESHLANLYNNSIIGVKQAQENFKIAEDKIHKLQDANAGVLPFISHAIGNKYDDLSYTQAPLLNIGIPEIKEYNQAKDELAQQLSNSYALYRHYVLKEDIGAEHIAEENRKGVLNKYIGTPIKTLGANLFQESLGGIGIHDTEKGRLTPHAEIAQNLLEAYNVNNLNPTEELKTAGEHTIPEMVGKTAGGVVSILPKVAPIAFTTSAILETLPEVIGAQAITGESGLIQEMLASSNFSQRVNGAMMHSYLEGTNFALATQKPEDFVMGAKFGLASSLGGAMAKLVSGNPALVKLSQVAPKLAASTGAIGGHLAGGATTVASANVLGLAHAGVNYMINDEPFKDALREAGVDYNGLSEGGKKAIAESLVFGLSHPMMTMFDTKEAKDIQARKRTLQSIRENLIENGVTEKDAESLTNEQGQGNEQGQVEIAQPIHEVATKSLREQAEEIDNSHEQPIEEKPEKPLNEPINQVAKTEVVQPIAEPTPSAEKPIPTKLKVLGQEVNHYTNYIPTSIDEVEPNAIYTFNATSKEGLPSQLHDVAYANVTEINGAKQENWHASISGEDLAKKFEKPIEKTEPIIDHKEDLQGAIQQTEQHLEQVKTNEITIPNEQRDNAEGVAAQVGTPIVSENEANAELGQINEIEKSVQGSEASGTQAIATAEGEGGKTEVQSGKPEVAETAIGNDFENGSPHDIALKHNNFEDFANAMSDFRDAHTAPSIDNASTDEKIEQGGDFSLREVASGFHNQPDDYFDSKVGARYYGYDTPEGKESFSAISKIINGLKKGAKAIKTITTYRVVPKDISVNKLQDYDWVTFSKSYAKNHGEHRFGEGEYKVIKQEVPIDNLWWDGNDINEWGYDTGTTKKYSKHELKKIWEEAHLTTKPNNNAIKEKQNEVSVSKQPESGTKSPKTSETSVSNQLQRTEKGEEEVKTENHQVYYNGKVVDMGYVPNKKEQFKFAGQRISDNLGTGGFKEDVGYIKTPNGEIFEVTKSKKSATPLKGEKLKEAEKKFLPKNEEAPQKETTITPEQVQREKDAKTLPISNYKHKYKNATNEEYYANRTSGLKNNASEWARKTANDIREGAKGKAFSSPISPKMIADALDTFANFNDKFQDGLKAIKETLKSFDEKYRPEIEKFLRQHKTENDNAERNKIIAQKNGYDHIEEMVNSVNKRLGKEYKVTDNIPIQDVKEAVKQRFIEGKGKQKSFTFDDIEEWVKSGVSAEDIINEIKDQKVKEYLDKNGGDKAKAEAQFKKYEDLIRNEVAKNEAKGAKITYQGEETKVEPTRISIKSMQEEHGHTTEFETISDQESSDRASEDLKQRASEKGISVDEEAANHVAEIMERERGGNYQISENDVHTTATHFTKLENDYSEAVKKGDLVAQEALKLQMDNVMGLAIRAMSNAAGRILRIFGNKFEKMADGYIKVTNESFAKALGIKEMPKSTAEAKAMADNGAITREQAIQAEKYIEKINELEAQLKKEKDDAIAINAKYDQKQIDDYIKQQIEKGIAAKKKTRITSKVSNRLRAFADKLEKSATLDNLGLGGKYSGVEMEGYSVNIKEAIVKVIRLVADGVDSATAISNVLKEYGAEKTIELENLFSDALYKASLPDKDDVLSKIEKLAKLDNANNITKEMVDKGLINDVVNSHITSTSKNDEVLNNSLADLKKYLPNVDLQTISDAITRKGEFKEITKKSAENNIKQAGENVVRLARAVHKLNALENADQYNAINATEGLTSEEKKAALENHKSEFEKSIDEKIANKRAEISEAKAKERARIAEGNQVTKLEAELADLQNDIVKKKEKNESIKVESERVSSLKKKIDAEKERIAKQQKIADNLEKLEAELDRVQNRRDRAKSEKKPQKELSEEEQKLKTAIAKEQAKWDAEKEQSRKEQSEINKAKAHQEKIDALNNELRYTQEEKEIFDKGTKNSKKTNEELAAIRQRIRDEQIAAGKRPETTNITSIKSAKEFEKEIAAEQARTDIDEEEKAHNIAQLKEKQKEAEKNTMQGVATNAKDKVDEIADNIRHELRDAIDNNDEEAIKKLTQLHTELNNISIHLRPNLSNLRDNLNLVHQSLKELSNKYKGTEHGDIFNNLADGIAKDYEKTSVELKRQHMIDQAKREEREARRKLNAGQYTELPKGGHDTARDNELLKSKLRTQAMQGELKGERIKLQEKNRKWYDKIADARTKLMIMTPSALEKITIAGITKPIIDLGIDQSFGRLAGMLTGYKPTEFRNLGKVVKSVAYTRPQLERITEKTNQTYVDAIKEYERLNTENPNSEETLKAKAKMLQAELDKEALYPFLFINANSLMDIRDIMVNGVTDFQQRLGDGYKSYYKDRNKTQEVFHWIDALVRSHGALKTTSERISMMNGYLKNIQYLQALDGEITPASRQVALDLAALTDRKEGKFMNNTKANEIIAKWKTSESGAKRVAAKMIFPVAKTAFAIGKVLIDTSIPVEVIAKTFKYTQEGMKMNEAEGKEFNWKVGEAAKGLKKGVKSLNLEQKRVYTQLMGRGLFAVASYLLSYWLVGNGTIKYGGAYNQFDPFDKNHKPIAGEDGQSLEKGEWEIGGQRMGKTFSVFMNHNPFTYAMRLSAVAHNANVQSESGKTTKEKEAEQKNWLSNLLSGETNELLNNIPLMTLIDAFQALTSGGSEGRYRLNKFISNQIPNPASGAVKHFDTDEKGNPIKRDVSSPTNLGMIWNMEKQDLPFLNKTLPIKKSK